jgi:hypothetical protein
VTEYRIVDASEAHAMAMAPHLRAADVAEVHAASGRTPFDALRVSLRCSTQAWTGLVDGTPACIWGVGPWSLAGGLGCPWLLGTAQVERHARAFLRRSRHCLGQMLETYDALENFVDARNATSLRWLAWLGFTIAPATPHGFLGLPFHRFSMRRGDV